VMLEVALVVVLAGCVAYAIHRFYPDSREQLGPELDDALFVGGVRAAWALAALGIVVVLLLWLLF
jgi:hypothetical protein